MYFTEHELEFLCLVYLVVLIKLAALTVDTVPTVTYRKVIYWTLVGIAFTSAIATSVSLSILLAKEVKHKEKKRQRFVFTFAILGVCMGLIPLITLFTVYISETHHNFTIALFVLSVAAASTFYAWELREIQNQQQFIKRKVQQQWT